MGDLKREIRIFLAEEEYELATNSLKELMINSYENSFVDNFFIHYYLAYCHFKRGVMDMCEFELMILKVLFSSNDENKEMYNYDYKKYINLKREVESLNE